MLLITKTKRAVLAESYSRHHSRNYFHKGNSEIKPNKIVEFIVCINFVGKAERCKYIHTHTHLNNDGISLSKSSGDKEAKNI